MYTEKGYFARRMVMNRSLSANPHARAFLAGKKYFRQYLFLTLAWLVLRIISTAPLIYALATKNFFNVPADHIPAVALLFCIPLWIFIVLPFRYRLGGQLASWFSLPGPDIDVKHYASWLKQGLLRLMKILPYLLPLFTFLCVLYYYYFFAGFNSFLLLIESAGKLIGGDFVAGVIVIVMLLLLLLTLAFFGWRKIMPFFYLEKAPVRLDGKRRRQLHKRCLTNATFNNFLIVLPPLVLSLVFLGVSLFERLTGSTMLDLVTIVTALTQFDFPPSVLLQVGGVLAVLYVPFVVFRKASLCACLKMRAISHDAA